jgi:hypothetical protein
MNIKEDFLSTYILSMKMEPDLKKISHDNGFDAFPMFSSDGKKLIFC